jgi:hypothetical protein
MASAIHFASPVVLAISYLVNVMNDERGDARSAERRRISVKPRQDDRQFTP